ncbi:MAG: ATP-binding protein [Thermodesulfobacteriota bacterium]|nr:ATP-binding protein [Thermodesulfobacteriota bacterium]
MYLGKLLRLRHTLAFRLTVWYAGIFILSSFGGFLVFYLMNISLIQEATDQELLNERTEFATLLKSQGIDAVKTAAQLEAESEGVDRMFYRVLTLSGKLLCTSDMSSWGNLAVDSATLQGLSGGTGYLLETMAMPEHQYDTRILYALIGPETVLQIGLSLEENAQFLKKFQRLFIVIIAAIAVFAGLIGWFLARRAVLGVEDVTRTARHISEGALEKRVPVKSRGDEIEQLATTFNSMLDRIQTLVIGMREMTDNIAHDLKTPITRVRGVAEMTLTTGKSIEDYRGMAANTIEECDRLLQMIRTMLDISEAEAGVVKLDIEETDICQVICEACELFEPIAEDKGIDIVHRLPPTCLIRADTQRLQRMIANLLDNALKYTEREGTVSIAANGDRHQILISVHDTGIGISKDDLPHIFDRFYRCDLSRSEPGVGLGLSLALAIARAHGGNITAESCVGKGSTFTISLPRAPLSH